MKLVSRLFIPSVVILSGFALSCGSVDFARKASRKDAAKEQTSSDYCLNHVQDVGCQNGKGVIQNYPCQNECQNPCNGSYQGQYQGTYQGTYQGQMPCNNDCMNNCNDNMYQPIPDKGYEPFPAQFPVSQNVVVDDCTGKICDVGQGPVQIPTVDYKGVPIDNGAISACFDNFHKGGVPTYGAWPVYNERSVAVNILGMSTFVDHSVGPRVIFVSATNIIGDLELVLGNPNALYCVNAVSIVGNIGVSSCYSNNVVFTNDVSILGGPHPGLIRCQ